MNKKRGFYTQLIRHLIQLAAFFLFPGLFITVFSAVRDLVTAFAGGNFFFGGLFPQIILVIMVFLVTALMGRFFCGFLCSFGMLQELLFFFSRRTLLKKVRIPERLDSAMKFLKYGVLVFITAGVWILALPVDSSWDPWGVFGMLVSGNLSLVSRAVPTVGFVLLLAIAAGSLFVGRFFCRYLCPLGAMFALVSGKRLYKIKRRSDTCTNCGLCTRECSMGIRIPEKEAVASGECVQCMQCLGVCPKGSLSANPARAIAGTAAAAAIGGTVVVGNLMPFPTAQTVSEGQVTESAEISESAENSENTENSENSENLGTGKYIDGVYTGEGEGFRGTTQVQVTVENGSIADITVLSFRDDREFFRKAQSGVIDAILAEQSPDVQPVSGATFSSNGIMEAVADALASDLSATEQPEAGGGEGDQDGSEEDQPGTGERDGTGAGGGSGSDSVPPGTEGESSPGKDGSGAGGGNGSGEGRPGAGGGNGSGEGEPGAGRGNGHGSGQPGAGPHGGGRGNGSGRGGHRGRQN